MQTDNGLPQDIKAQISPTPGGSAQATAAGRVRFEYLGQPTELLGKGLLALLLLCITFGFAAPWIAVWLRQYTYSKIRIHTEAGVLNPEFTGTGFLCFVQVFLSYFLVCLTLGIYAPWYLANVIRFFVNNSHAVGSDGTRYRLEYTGTGGELFGPYLVNMLLTGLTCGIYAPWAICDLERRISEKTRILKGDEQIGRLDFVGTGGGLIGTFLIGMFLSVITLYIYLPWFQCNMQRFFMRNTGVYIGSRRYRGEFTGKGGDLFIIFLQTLLVPLTLGLYIFWIITKENRFYVENTTFQAE